MPHDTRDEVVDFVTRWSEKSGIATSAFVGWLGISRSKYYDWSARYGRANEHNARIPRDHWLMDWERDRIIGFFTEHPLDGYRRIAFMMLDREIVAASPSTVYRVLGKAGLLGVREVRVSKKGTGFEQPLAPHEHWHIDISYINLGGTFYYLCCVLDGCSRAILHWELRESMKEAEVELVLQRAREKHPGASPRIISDNGPQFVAKDFKEFIRLAGMTHVRTSPYYPQSNGKIERFHLSLKSESIRMHSLSTREQAGRVITEYIRYYNEERLNSAIGYIAPADRLAGRHEAIHAERDRRLEEARARRAAERAKQKALEEKGMFCYIGRVSGRTGLCGDATRAPGHQEGLGRPLRRRDPEEGLQPPCICEKSRGFQGAEPHGERPEKHEIGMVSVS